ncbi:dihydrofolate reductase family protein [Leptospira sp. 'Mane']|uniref:dihydrofolate reductase family protein n=1 Tax=Leptospira sp. 'Mane' TaxID=3387407 RepID=UPI00398A5655
MRKVVFGINITSDGYCSHEGMIADDDLHKYFTNLLSNASDILYGRITYQLMVPFWPDVARNQSMSETSNEFAQIFTSLKKILFSNTLKHVEDTNTRLSNQNIADEVIALKKQPGKDILVGSLSLASQLSQHHLIDEYHFVIHPVLVGKGPRLFDNLSLEENIRLDFLGSETFKSGTIAHHYKRHT